MTHPPNHEPGHAGAAQPLTVLITGFGPFPGVHFNPTPALVGRLVRLRRPALSAVRLIPHVFVTSYADVDANLPKLLAVNRPDIVLMFGLAARTRFLRIETTARQGRSSLLPDAAGLLPKRRKSRTDGMSALRGRAPFPRLLMVARSAGVDARLSRNAGRYLCNELYWRMLEQEYDAPTSCVFMHVPQLARGGRPVARMNGYRPSAGMADLVRAGEAILRMLIADARQRRRSTAP